MSFPYESSETKILKNEDIHIIHIINVTRYTCCRQMKPFYYSWRCATAKHSKKLTDSNIPPLALNVHR